MVAIQQGCLVPVKVIIPKGSLLDPSDQAAVVGGNVLTSQRVVDVILSAFGACASSQGCMNNITLGTEDWGYYETVAGGSGAVSLLYYLYNCREMYLHIGKSTELLTFDFQFCFSKNLAKIKIYTF